MADANDHPSHGRREMAGMGHGTIDAGAVERWYEAHGPELRRFVLGVTRDPASADDVLQATFAKAVEFGHTARDESSKGWLFRVAFNEALVVRRRGESRDRGNRRLASLGPPPGERPDERLIRGETIEAVRRALERLPAEQRRIVAARMYEDKSFAEIADDFGLPLGTVLTRMRRALEKLRRTLRPGE